MPPWRRRHGCIGEDDRDSKGGREEGQQEGQLKTGGAAYAEGRLAMIERERYAMLWAKMCPPCADQ